MSLLVPAYGLVFSVNLQAQGIIQRITGAIDTSGLFGYNLQREFAPYEDGGAPEGDR